MSRSKALIMEYDTATRAELRSKGYSNDAIREISDYERKRANYGEVRESELLERIRSWYPHNREEELGNYVGLCIMLCHRLNCYSERKAERVYNAILANRITVKRACELTGCLCE